jgi:hypothetical protein
VQNGRDPVVPLRSNFVGEQHVGARQRAVEELGSALGQHHRRHRPELLAPLDVVHPLEVLGAHGVREEAPVPERARPPFATALEPCDDSVSGERLGDLLGEVVRPLEAKRRALEPLGELVLRPFAPERRGRHRPRRVAELGG